MAYQHSDDEYADIHFLYGFYNGYLTAAVAEYRGRFLERRIPTKRTFHTVHKYLQETKTFPTFGSDRPQK